MNKYLFIGGCSIAGGIFYNSVQNLKVISDNEEYNRSIFNLGMFNGFTLGIVAYYTNITLKKLLK